MRNEKSSNRNNTIYGTVLMLALGFIVLIGLMFVFSDGFHLGKKGCVAIVNINREITVESTPQSLFVESVPGSEDIANAIYGLNDRNDVAAVVFVINSPGGSVVGSREIYNSVLNLSKPKVGYFREVAASGAYYIATPLQYIVSDPAALTGNIGAVTTFADLSSLFEKIGMNVTSITSGEMKDIGSPSRPMTDDERSLMQQVAMEAFEDFKAVILKNRGSKLNMAKFDVILDGRVVTGKMAKDIGLVDQIGTKQDAINKAKELAGLPEEALICNIDLGGGKGGLFSTGSLLDTFHIQKMELKFQ
ncbi:MAG: signal peptide peptidase SppA [Candidatus Micrarchaeota archaeon]